MKHAPTKSRSAGFSLIELMISVVLGLLLIAGAIATYLSSQRSYTETEQYSTLVDNARFAELTMADALLHAGFFGEAAAIDISRFDGLQDPDEDCGGPTSPNGQGSADVYNIERYIFGATIVSTGKAQASGTDLDCIVDGREDTDVLIIKRAIPRPLTDGDRSSDTPVLNGVIDSPDPLQPETIYVMSNNMLGMLFDGGKTPPSIMAGGDVFNGTAWPYLFEAYYIRDEAPDSEEIAPFLARKTLVWDGTAMVIETENLVEGVENLQLQIGLDTDNDDEIDSYVDVDEVEGEEWTQVGSVEAYLLVRSVTRDPQFEEEKTYHLGGDNTAAPDAGNDPEVDLRQFRRLRVSTQASLRNPKLMLRR